MKNVRWFRVDLGFMVPVVSKLALVILCIKIETFLKFLYKYWNILQVSETLLKYLILFYLFIC